MNKSYAGLDNSGILEVEEKNDFEIYLGVYIFIYSYFFQISLRSFRSL